MTDFRRAEGRAAASDVLSELIWGQALQTVEMKETRLGRVSYDLRLPKEEGRVGPTWAGLRSAQAGSLSRRNSTRLAVSKGRMRPTTSSW